MCVILHPPALEAEQVFGVLSFLMALSTGALCLVFALCWTSETVRSYSNTRSLLMAGQALYPHDPAAAHHGLHRYNSTAQNKVRRLFP